MIVIIIVHFQREILISTWDFIYDKSESAMGRRDKTRLLFVINPIDFNG